MITDIEAGEINLVLTKDLSRLGRDYIQTGQYTELYFPSHRVRFIAVGDGYDSACSSADLIPFRNVLNEMYARDISGKIKASLQVRMEEGAFVGNFAPYGYQKSQHDRHLLIPDSTVVPIVLRIFTEVAAGVSPRNIADALNTAKVLPPALYRCQNNKKLDPAHYTVKGLWTANTIIKILHNPVYLGHMVQGKHKKISFKSNLTLPVPPESRITVHHTHTPLVTEELFASCEEQLRRRTYKKEQR